LIVSNEKAIMISMKDVTALTSLSRTTINRLRIDGRFPSSVTLGDKRVGFVRQEVVAWIDAKIAARQVPE
jgi:prophage regulatory protein